jgi:UDP-2,3-diacylglucosamine pyrophosphatase LpxH
LLVTHGGQCVGVRYAKWRSSAGERGQGLARFKRRLGSAFRSLAAGLRFKVNGPLKFIGDFEHALVAEARRRGVDGVVCGHIHHAAHRDVDGIKYLNCGDWTDHCTAIAEDALGRLHIIDWLEAMGERQAGSAIRHLSEAA